MRKTQIAEMLTRNHHCYSGTSNILQAFGKRGHSLEVCELYFCKMRFSFILRRCENYEISLKRKTSLGQSPRRKDFRDSLLFYFLLRKDCHISLLTALCSAPCLKWDLFCFVFNLGFSSQDMCLVEDRVGGADRKFACTLQSSLCTHRNPG